MNPAAERPLDVVVVGAGPAGLSAGLILARARWRTLIVDSERPANAASREVRGMLGHQDGPPAVLRRAGREQVLAYPGVEIRRGEVTGVSRSEDGFGVEIDGSSPVQTRVLLLTHGLNYEPPALAGVDRLWGNGVFHCPFCDGWEVRDAPLAVYGTEPPALMQARLLTFWTDDVTLCTGGAELDAEQAMGLVELGVEICEEPVRELQGTDGLERIVFEGGSD